MHIIAIRPVSGHGNVVARFDAQLTPDIRMFGLKLVQSPRGARVYPPSSNTNNLATFAPAFAEALARAASVALDGEARDRTAA